MQFQNHVSFVLQAWKPNDRMLQQVGFVKNLICLNLFLPKIWFFERRLSVVKHYALLNHFFNSILNFLDVIKWVCFWRRQTQFIRHVNYDVFWGKVSYFLEVLVEIYDVYVAKLLVLPIKKTQYLNALCGSIRHFNQIIPQDVLNHSTALLWLGIH